MTMNKIAIMGKLRSGKNTVADYITGKHGHVQFAFGEGITEVINRYFPEAFEGGKPREHYQVIGQSFRKLNPDIWIEKLDATIKDWANVAGEDFRVIITDLRQPNEYQYAKECGYTVIKVDAEESTRLQRVAEAGDNFDESLLNHETEVSLEQLPYDYLISNNGTLEDLYNQVDAILNSLQGKGC